MSIRFELKNVRVNYPHLFKATAFDDTQTAKYSITVVIPKDHPDVAVAKRAYFEAGKETFAADFVKPGVWPKGYTCSLKDADVATDSMGVILAEKNPEYKGCYILEANSTRRPVVVNRRAEAITEEDGGIYSGCYVNVKLAAAGYTFGKVKKGIKAYLNGVQFVADGERFGPESMDGFDALDGEDDDFMA